MQYAILDIDGCVLDNSARINYLLAGDYQTFVDMWETDVPIPQGVWLYQQLFDRPDTRVVFLTARDEGQRRYTIKQLDGLFRACHGYDLLMRPSGSTWKTEKDVDLKIRLLRESGIKLADVFLAVDDRNVIVEAYRALGLVAYQLATGY